MLPQMWVCWMEYGNLPDVRGAMPFLPHVNRHIFGRAWMALLTGLLAWWMLCWLLISWYFDGLTERAVRDEADQAMRFMNNVLSGFDRQIAVRMGTIAVLARTESARNGVLGRDPDLDTTLDHAARALAFDRLFLLDVDGSGMAESHTGTQDSLIDRNFAAR